MSDFSLIPSSISIVDQDSVRVKNYTVKNNSILLESDACEKYDGTSLHISYRTFPYNIVRLLSVQNDTYTSQEKVYTIVRKNNKGNKLSALDYNGSFSRGFAVGNAQDLNVNSAFNLQLNGDIGNGIQISAALTDANIPIQADGNTQYLQEFDRVFIQLKKDSSALVAGDYSIYNRPSHFLRYQKKVKGLGLQTSHHVKTQTVSANADISVSRGNYARQKFEISDGNQGPYKLLGNNRELFLIILSGSEKIYLDGKLLIRGRTEDYIIDYNRAEITFTHKNILNRSSRVIAEYEYQTQSYLRTLYTVGSQVKGKDYEVNLNFLSEQDSKNAISEGLLDSTSTKLLAGIGNDVSRARISSVKPMKTTDSSREPTYIKEPISLPNDTISYILVRSDDTSKTLYTARFSDVGNMNGRYSLDQSSTTNGRIYQYVGKNNGRYEPSIRITPPESRKYLTLSTLFEINKSHSISAEIIANQVDLNRYSSIGDRSNKGIGLHLSYTGNIVIDSTRKIITNISSEVLNEKFLPLHTHRSTEFGRDWNVDTFYGVNQVYLEGSASYHSKNNLNITYKSSLYTQKNSFFGLKNGIDIGIQKNTFSAYTQASYLTTNSPRLQTAFLRPHVRINKSIFNKKIWLRYNYTGEDNRIRDTKTDSLQLSSKGINEHSYSLKFSPSKRYNIELQYKHRIDKYLKKNDLHSGSKANEYTININSQETRWITTNARLGYRQNTIDSTITALRDLKSTTTALADISMRLKTPTDIIKGQVSYVTNGGTAPKLEYYYEKVQAGQGDFIYIGEPDSTLHINNFRHAPNLGTGNYIRVPLYNDEYISTQNNSLSYTFSTNLKHAKSQKSNILYNLVKNLRTTHNLQLDNRVNRLASNQIKNVLKLGQDEQTISRRVRIGNSILYNSNNSRLNITYASLFQNNLNTQINGQSNYKTIRNSIEARYSIRKGMDFGLQFLRNNLLYTFEFQPFENRDILRNAINPKINLRPNKKYVFEISYTFDHRRQRILNKEQTKGHKISNTIVLRDIWGFHNRTTLEYTYVDYKGQQNSLIEFDLLEGLKKGNNFRISTTITRKINDITELSFTMDSHKYGKSNIVNIFRAQARAIF